MKLYIDIDSGTVLNGPIYVVDIAEEDYMAFALDTDDDARQYALANGQEL